MIQQLWSLVLTKALKIHDQIKTFISLVTLFIIVVTYKLALAICLYNDQTMSCYSCWPSNTLWKEFRMEIRNEALCALGKTSRTGLQILRYFQEVILWAWFLHLLIPRKVLKCFMVSLLLMTSSNLHGNSRILLQKNVLHCTYSSFTQITYILTFPPTSLEQFLRDIWNAVSWSIVLIFPQIKPNSQLWPCTFLFFS